MAYGTIKVDTVTFTSEGIDTSVSISGLVRNPTFSGNITSTSTISGVTIQGGTLVSGTTVTGSAGQFNTITGGIVNFTTITGVTAAITSGVFASGTAANPSISILGDSNTGIYSPGADQLAISTGGTQRLNIDGGGNINISSANAVIWALNPSTNYIKLYNTGTNGVDFSSNTSFTFLTGGTERARIDSSGRLLVGTSSITNNLRLNQSFAVVSAGNPTYGGASITNYGGATNTASPVLDLNRSRGTTDGSMTKVESGDRLGVISFRGADGSAFLDGAAIEAYADAATSSNDLPTRLVFSTTADGASSPTERLRIDSTGQIEANSLGSAAAPVWTFLSDPNTGIYSPGADQLAISTNGTGRLFVDASGNVGINTTSGTSYGMNLAVVGTIGLIPSTFNTVGSSIFIKSQLGTSGGEEIIRNEITSFTNGSNYGTATIFSTRNGVSASERLRITSAGNVGIGTTSPSNTLHVTAAANHGIRLERSGAVNPGNGYVLVGSNGTLSVRADTELYLETGTSSATVFLQGAAERARIDSSGRLLVGTSTSVGGSSSSQYAKLQVLGSTFSANGGGILALARGETAASISAGETIGIIGFTDNAGGTFAEIYSEADAAAGTNDYPGRLVFSTTADGASSPTERMRITSDAYVRLASGTGGIQFNGDTAAANALDDYEEGTFTPVLQFGGATTGITYSLQSGRYTKIGRLVTVVIAVTLSSKGTATGAATFAGLPFTAGSIATYSCYPQVLSFADMLVFSSDALNTTVNLRQVTNAGTASNLTDANFANNTLLYLTGRYEV